MHHVLHELYYPLISPWDCTPRAHRTVYSIQHSLACLSIARSHLYVQGNRTKSFDHQVSAYTRRQYGMIDRRYSISSANLIQTGAIRAAHVMLLHGNMESPLILWRHYQTWHSPLTAHNGYTPTNTYRGKSRDKSH